MLMAILSCPAEADRPDRILLSTSTSLPINPDFMALFSLCEKFHFFIFDTMFAGVGSDRIPVKVDRCTGDGSLSFDRLLCMAGLKRRIQS